MKCWYFSHRRAAGAQSSPRIREVSLARFLHTQSMEVEEGSEINFDGDNPRSLSYDVYIS